MLSITPVEFPVTGHDTTTADLLAITKEIGPQTPPFPSGLEGQIDPALWRVVKAAEGAVAQGLFAVVPGSTAPADMDLTNIAEAHITKAGTIHVYAEMNSFDASALKSIEALGLKIISANKLVGVVETWAPYDKIDDLAALSAVDLVRMPMYGILDAGMVTTAGDGILNADDVRARFTAVIGNVVDGSGVKIGVISDGVDHRSLVQGGLNPDLPSITINSLLPGAGDEGTAMLEIVHDLAPGAQLYFSSGIAGEAAMVDSINWMVSQGVKVIVDDVRFLDQHYFSDDVIAQAVASAINSGVVYVSSAGNTAQLHYQGQWSNAGGVHDFDATAGVDNVLDVGVVPSNGRINIALQWSDPWGTSGNNYNLGLWDVINGGYVAVANAPQTGSHLPFEFIDWTNNTGSAVNVGIVIDDFNSPASRELELFVAPRNFSFAGLTDNDRTTVDSVAGHKAVADVIAVGAVSTFYTGTGYDQLEPYSSQGPSTIYTNFGTQDKTQRQSLDGVAVDGVATRIGELGFFFNPFYGTSAAAPHVAAIAALILDANPSLSPAAVASILSTTAQDILASGYQNDSGAGLFNALGAVYKAYTPSAPNLTELTDTGKYSTDDITSITMPQFTGTVPAGSVVRLYVNGVYQGGQQLNPGQSLYGPLSTLTLLPGTYPVTIKVGENSSTPDANLSNASAALSITIDTTAPKVSRVLVGGSTWTTNFRQALVNTGKGTTDGYGIPSGPDQLKPIWFINANQIVVQFDGPVDVQQGDLVLSGMSAPSINGFSYNSATNTGVWTLSQSIGNDDLTITVDTAPSTAIQDIAGNKLDGEWTNSSSQYPSGNGAAGGNFVFRFDVLPADVNQDRVVNIFDINVVTHILNWGTVGPTGNTDGDDTINIFDFNAISSRWGTTNDGGSGLMSMTVTPFHVAFAAYLRDIAKLREDKALLAWLDDNSAEKLGQAIEAIGSDTSTKEVEQLQTVLDGFFAGLSDFAKIGPTDGLVLVQA